MRNFIHCLFAAGSLTRFATLLTLLAGDATGREGDQNPSAASPPGPYVTGGPDYNNQLTNAEWMTGSCQTGREQSPINF